MDLQLVDGDGAVFTVEAVGSNLTYQWERSGTDGIWSPIAGATQASLIAPSALSDSGSQFRVKVSRDNQVTISAAVSLTVTSAAVAPSITVQPTSIQVAEGADAAFTLTASGTSLGYRWQTSTDGTNWADAVDGNHVTLLLRAVGLASNNLQLRVLVTNAAGTVTSDAANLTVTNVASAPAFVSQPASVAVNAPATATFSATVSGTPQPSFQWQRSVDGGTSYADIPGATSNSYTTPATSTTQSGYRFRAVARNSVSSTTSNEALLTVSAAPSAPAVTTQPASASAAVGELVSFSVGYSGVPTPSLQWQLSTNGGTSFTNINGAVASTYSHVVAAGESGRLYRVVLTNSTGSVASQNAQLTLTSAVSVLQGRAWGTAVPLEAGDDAVLTTFSAQAIDDQGTVTVLFAKVTGGRLALHAVRGVPGAAGGPPVFGTPVVLDAAAPFGFRAGSTSDGPPTLAVSPNGNAVVGWNHRAPCTSTTYNTNTSATCNYWYSTRYIAAQSAWEAPVLVGDMYVPGMEATINDAGEVAALYGVTTSAGELVPAIAVGWRGAGPGAFAHQVWPTDISGTFIPRTVTLDSSSRLVVSGTVNQPSSASLDIAVYRGTVGGGLSATREVVDLRSATVSYMQALGNPQGQQVILWAQNNGTRETVYAATLDAAAGTWSVTDTGETRPADGASKATLTRAGDFIWYLWRACASKRRIGGAWEAKASLPSAMCNVSGVLGNPVVSPNGHVLSVLSNSAWFSYDAGRNEVIAAPPTGTTTGPGYLLGFDHSMSGVPGTLLLSDAGFGAYISVNGFSVIPRADLPAGTSTGVDNVWGWYLK